MMLLPVILLFIIIGWLLVNPVNPKMILVYGFIVFFGWITVMIFGMTFKTLPFIVWNKVYRLKAGLGKTPNPKDLFSSYIFRRMMIVYLVGFILFIIGIYNGADLILKFATLFLFLGAVLYNFNVMKILSHKPVSL
jgi:hypothetical protein